MGNLQIGYLRNPKGTDCKPVMLSGQDKSFYEIQGYSFFPDNNFMQAKKYVTKQEFRKQSHLEDFLNKNPEMKNNVIHVNEDNHGQIVDVVVIPDITNKQVEVIGNTVAAQYGKSGWTVNVYAGEVSPATFRNSFFHRPTQPRPKIPFHPKI